MFQLYMWPVIYGQQNEERNMLKLPEFLSLQGGSTDDTFDMLERCAGPRLWSSDQSSWLQNGDVLCSLWGTNWIYICYVDESRPPLWSSGQNSWLHNGDVLCFLWGTNRIYICYVEESRPPLWSSGQSSWLQIQRSRVIKIPQFVSHQIFLRGYHHRKTINLITAAFSSTISQRASLQISTVKGFGIPTS
jgi:hypothetical protein